MTATNQKITTDDPVRENLHSSACILFVDDEQNILSSLRRLFRPLGYTILLASSGKEGLEVLEKNKVDLIVSDMRMPEMDGAELLTIVAKKWPDTIRILLTGYADMTSTIAAINEGKIYQYISKPWEDHHIKISVDYALKQKAVERERDQLRELTIKQNKELQDFNSNLEAKVRSRTSELAQTMAMWESAHKELQQTYISSIKVFSNIVEMRDKKMAGHSRRVADLARTVAVKYGMSEDDVQQVVFAGLLHNFGKVALPDNLISQPLSSLSKQDRSQVAKHPIVGEGILMALDYLRDAAKMIRSQGENFNGLGYPDKLSGNDIPLGARIIGLVSDFYSLQAGTFSTKQMSVSEAREFIQRNSGIRYDPALVELLNESIGSINSQATQENSNSVKSNGLKPGMILAKDLLLNTGVLLLTKGHNLDEKIIQRIQMLETSMNDDMTIYIEKKKG